MHVAARLNNSLLIYQWAELGRTETNEYHEEPAIRVAGR